MSQRSSALLNRFADAVKILDDQFRTAPDLFEDDETETNLRQWLGKDLPWSGSHVTDDEWFFITTLYGEMTLSGQRTHIRNFFQPLFVEAAGRDIRNFSPGLPRFQGLRSAWMENRLCRMADVLNERDQTMMQYADMLRELEKKATPQNSIPALDAIKHDHKATGWKTLSCFVRDCVKGNCFPIDSRVRKVLATYQLPAADTDEPLLVRLSLAIHQNPRIIARMFYMAGA